MDVEGGHPGKSVQQHPWSQPTHHHKIKKLQFFCSGDKNKKRFPEDHVFFPNTSKFGNILPWSVVTHVTV